MRINKIKKQPVKFLLILLAVISINLLFITSVKALPTGYAPGVDGTFIVDRQGKVLIVPYAMADGKAIINETGVEVKIELNPIGVSDPYWLAYKGYNAFRPFAKAKGWPMYSQQPPFFSP